MTALASALRGAGIRSAAERLADTAMAAIETHPKDYDAARRMFRDAVRSDAELLCALFERFEEAAITPVLATAAQEYHRRHKPRVAARGEGLSPRGIQISSASTPANPSAGREAVTASLRRSLLDTFMVNGRALGDVSAGEARSWAKARKRDARFVELITSGIMDDQPLRRWIKPEEADAAMARARETGNE